MEGSRIWLQDDTEARIRQLVPVDMGAEDLGWFTDWVLMLGLGMIDHALKKRPDLTVGDLISMSFGAQR